jgi:PAS domain S-box-containing protein
MQSPPEKKSLLIVDRSPELESILRSAFSDDILTIRRTGSGKEALRRLTEWKPDLILSEYLTDDVDGSSLLHSMLEHREFKSLRPIPLVLISEEPDRQLRGTELFSLGLMGWYVRPMEPHSLKEIVVNCLRLHDAFENSQMLKQEVKKSEYRYRDLLENANDFIFTLDEEGHFVYLNNRFKPLTGCEKEDWLGRPFLSVIDSFDRDEALDHYRMTHQGRSRVFESRMVSRSPEPTILSISLTPIVEKGKIIGAMGIGRDVVEQKRMEKEILDLKNFNESIIESMEAGLLTVDLNGVITSLNSGGRNILGWTAEEILGKPLNSVLGPREAESLMSQGSGARNPLSRKETDLTLKSGRKASIGFTVTDRIDNRRQKVGTIISFRDITLLKQMQTEVIRMDRLASLGVLSSGIAHEIKNPLAGIKSLAQACDEEFPEDDSRREYLARIIRQVNRLDDLLRTFFAYAKPKPPDRSPHPLHEILKEVSHLLAKKMEEARIHYVADIPPELPSVMVDAQQIQQVFLNLLLNAIDAMPDGGKLAVFASESKSSLNGMIRKTPQEEQPAVDFVEILISDSGMGIPEDKLETIFNPFFTTKPSGLGLGLSIVYRIIEEHCGDIRVTSGPSQGTQFRIYLPTGVFE